MISHVACDCPNRLVRVVIAKSKITNRVDAFSKICQDFASMRTAPMEYSMFERFTDRARKTMALANQEALRFNHESIGTEHMLLGLVKEGSGVGANVLKNLGIDLRKVRVEAEKLLKPGVESRSFARLPQTSRAKKAVEAAIQESRNLNHRYIGTEHILLGLLNDQDSLATQVLTNLGLSLDSVRAGVISLLDIVIAAKTASEMLGAIFAVTTLRENAIPTANKMPRTVGFYHTLHDAERCLSEGWGDLPEAGWYQLAVIEKVSPGLYPIIKDVYFYKFDKDSEKWAKIDPPSWYNVDQSYMPFSFQ